MLIQHTLSMISKLLDHKRVQTTQRYAHLLDNPLRAGIEQVGDMLRAKPKLVEVATIAWLAVAFEFNPTATGLNRASHDSADFNQKLLRGRRHDCIRERCGIAINSRDRPRPSEGRASSTKIICRSPLAKVILNETTDRHVMHCNRNQPAHLRDGRLLFMAIDRRASPADRLVEEM